jgi:plasmid stabilization system protein ParE
MTTNYGVASMARTRRYHPLVADELASATGYYDDVSIELGNRFRSSVRQSLTSIQDYPESYGVIHQQIRAATMDRFPYVVLFELREKTVFILSIVHAASDRDGWFDCAI